MGGTERVLPIDKNLEFRRFGEIGSENRTHLAAVVCAGETPPLQPPGTAALLLRPQIIVSTFFPQRSKFP